MFNNSKKDKINDNDWAKKVDGSMIHVNNAPNGKKGYYCLGCNEEMQAVHFKEKNYRSYFRHDARNVNIDNAECVLASRTYREKIAKDYFFRVKQINLPAVYKYPSQGQNGSPYLIKDAYSITAHAIKSELTFFEDFDSNICYGRNPKIEDRYNLIRPDLSFFNESGKPVLLIELVVNHKVDEVKKEKIRRLGIDCVQVIIPRKETLQIEKHLEKSSSYKWLYNEVEANTLYIPIPERDSEEILSIDEEQRRLFEESFICRKSQLGNLIRSINRSIRTESYKGIERYFESEISRIEKATIRARSRLEEMEREEEASIISEFKERIRRSRGAKIKEERNLKAEQEKYHDLEKRYFRKRRDIEWESSYIKQEQINHDAAIERERESQTQHRTSEQVRKKFEERRSLVIGKVESNIQEEQGRSREIGKRRVQQDTGLRARFKKQENELISKSEAATQRERERSEEIKRRRIELEPRLRYNFERRHKENKSKEAGIDTELEQLRISTERIRIDLEGIKSHRKRVDGAGSSRLEVLQKHIAQRINEKDIHGNDELSKRISSVLQAGRLSRDFEDRRSIEQKLKYS